MTVRRRDLLGAAALVGTAATIPASSEAALLAPELRDRLFASYYDQTRLWGYANRRFACQRRGEIYWAAPILAGWPEPRRRRGVERPLQTNG